MLLVGDSSVGKSSLLTQYTDHKFAYSYISTIGVDFKIHHLKVDDKVIKLQIWDTAGQERFRTITSAYYKGAHGVMFVYDITDRETFENVKQWMREVDRYADPGIIRMLVGNKIDLSADRAVLVEEGQKLANEMSHLYSGNPILFMETSAKGNNNVDSAFSLIATALKQLRGMPRVATDIGNQRVITPGRPVLENNCCIVA